MKLTGFTSILLFMVLYAAAQDQPIHVSGTVVGADSLEPLPFVHILVNRHTTTGVTTDGNGRFSIKFNKSDTLFFSSVGYHTGKVAFRDSAETSFTGLTILLQPRTFRLRPVEIFAYDLEEIINRKKKENLSLERTDPEPLFEPTEKKEKPAVGLGVSPGGGASLEGAITAFANLFNREFKERKKLQQLIADERIAARRKEQREMLVRNYREIAKKAVNLDSAAFEEFMHIYEPKEAFMAMANDYELTLRILKDYRDYRIRFQLEEISLDELLENARFQE